MNDIDLWLSEGKGLSTFRSQSFPRKRFYFSSVFIVGLIGFIRDRYCYPHEFVQRNVPSFLIAGFFLDDSFISIGSIIDPRTQNTSRIPWTSIGKHREVTMDHALENYKQYIGKPASELPTPAIILSLPIIKKNIEALHRDVEKLAIGFRPHVKTLKVCSLKSLAPARRAMG